MSLARGRPFSIPITRVLRECDDWHKSSAASDPQDGAMTSIAVLRRDLVRLTVWCPEKTHQLTFQPGWLVCDRANTL